MFCSVQQSAEPPQRIIRDPVQTAVWFFLGDGAPTVEVGDQLSQSRASAPPRPMTGQPLLSIVLMTLGLAAFLEGITAITFGIEPKNNFPAPYSPSDVVIINFPGAFNDTIILKKTLVAAFIVAMLILAGVVYILGLQDEVVGGLAGPAATIFGYLGIAFSVAIGTDILFMIVLGSLEAIVSRMKGVNVVYGPRDSAGGD